jgi:hypothetical protein
VEYILEQFPGVDWIHNRRVFDGCSKRLPDVQGDLGFQALMTEVDENLHSNYDCSCENKRLMELSQDFGHRPIVVIRFNPDAYKTSTGTVSSCWGYDKRGICVLKKSKLKEWAERLECLRAQIQYWIENPTDKTVEVIQLFYDTV